MRTPFLKPRAKPKKTLSLQHRTSEQLDMMDRMLTAHMYVANIIMGNGDVSMFLTIVMRLFIGLELSKFVNESKQTLRVITPGLSAMWTVGNRIRKKHKVSLENNERDALVAALCLIDNMCHMVTASEYKLCISNASMKVGGMPLTMQSLEPYKEMQ